MAVRGYCALWVVVLITVFPALAETTDGSLRFVTVLWRHGDRAPSDGTFKTDTANGDSTWPQGFGELSEEGMKQHQFLGNYLRQRYVIDYSFLSANYSAKEIYIRSSDYNRTIMSALSNMAGMYPAAAGIDMLNNIPIWQPIPIHTRPRDIDPMLWMDCPCPKYDEIYHGEILKSAEVQQIESDNKDFLEFLAVKTGKDQVTLDDAWDIWDPLNCERIHNDTHTWPDWVTDQIFKNITVLSDLGTTMEYHDPRLQRFRGSLLFNDIATRFDQKVNRPNEIQPEQLKYYVYSAHDTTIMALLENLGDFNGHLPEYASAVLFELHQKADKSFIVKTWYVNETYPQNDPVRVIVKGCDDQTSGECSLDTFVKIANSKAPTDWYAECSMTSNNGTTTPSVAPCGVNNQPAIIAAIVLGVTTGVFLLAFIVVLSMYCRLRKRDKIGQVAY